MFILINVRNLTNNTVGGFFANNHIENALVQAKLDAVEKKIKAAEINTKRNNEDIVVLSNLTTTKETELQQLEEAFSKNTATMQDTGNR